MRDGLEARNKERTNHTNLIYLLNYISYLIYLRYTDEQNSYGHRYWKAKNKATSSFIFELCRKWKWEKERENVLASRCCKGTGNIQFVLSVMSLTSSFPFPHYSISIFVFLVLSLHFPILVFVLLQNPTFFERMFPGPHSSGIHWNTSSRWPERVINWLWVTPSTTQIHQKQSFSDLYMWSQETVPTSRIS